MEQQQIQKRQTAVHVHANDLLSGEYVVVDGWTPNFIRLANGTEVSRVNMVGVVVLTQPIQAFVPTVVQMTIEDGSGKIDVRSFDPIQVAQNIDVGTPVLLIGRPRKYQETMYIVPEIIRKVSLSFVEKRKPTISHTVSKTVVKETPIQNNVEEETEEPKKESENILDIIEGLDKGEGVVIEDIIKVIEKFNHPVDPKKRIMNLLLTGDVFEVRPGRIRVLK